MSYRAHIDGRFALDRPLSVEHKVTLEKHANERHEGRRYPDYPYCQWVPSEDGAAIEYTEDEISYYHCTEWLEYIVDTFLKPWGYVLNGRATWHGEDLGSTDLGVIVVRDNDVREADAIVTYPDPFADDQEDG
jgi:hypothetical protein